MEKILTVSIKIRGTEKEIERIIAEVCTISAREEVISLYKTESEEVVISRC